MALAFVVIEEHTGRTVELRNDNPLSTVDDEGTVLGHQGDLPHVDFLLFDVFDGLVRRVAIVDDQANLDTQRSGIGHATQLTLFDIERWRTETVAHVLQGRIAGEALDREHGLERRVQANLVALVGRTILLEKVVVGIKLDGQQVRHIHHLGQFAEILADAFFLSI